MIRVRVGEGRLAGDVAVVITRVVEGEPGRQLLRLGPGWERSWEWHTPGAAAEPTLILDDEEAMALMNALASHYQGFDDQRALRKDYDHERGRVDRLTDALVGIVQKATGGTA